MKNPFPYQQAQIDHALTAPGHRWLFADEMGLGKTLQAIRACREQGCDRLLVVAPAMARRGWQREFCTWWPDRFGSLEDVASIDMTPTRKTQSKKKAATWERVLQLPARVVSPELLNAAREREWLDGGTRPAVMLDEVHMYVQPAAKRSGVVRKLLSKYRGTLYGCTATPIPNRPDGAWNLFDLIWPRRFGAGYGKKVAYGFVERYMEREYNAYGSRPVSLREEHAEELRRRLTWMMSRTTRTEVAHLLPSRQLLPLTLLPTDDVDSAVLEWTTNALAETTHVVVLTHRRKRAKHLAQLLGGANTETPLVHIDGATPATQRGERLDWLKAQPRGILVSTMHAVARSISLSWAARGLIAELYWSPERLVQVVGRFARLDGTEGAVIHVMCGGGTVQERIAVSVSDKLWDMKALIPEGETEQGLSSALSGGEDDLLEAAYCVCSDAELESLTILEGDYE
jgi:superfamily II DNA or RNA helicase